MIEKAPGGPGRPELLCVGSTGGLSVHLMDPVAKEVLCRGLRSGRVAMGLGLSPFAVSGCKRCATVAVERGYDVVLGFDDERVALDGFDPMA